MILDAFTKTYQERAYQFTTMVQHKGVVLAFAMDADRHIYYSVLDLSAADRGNNPQKNTAPASPFDKDAWPASPNELIFPNEIAEVGYGVADQTALPVFRKGAVEPEKQGTPLPDPGDSAPPFKADFFRSTTARLSAPVPFQVVSDGQYVIVFRQAVPAGDPNNLNKQDPRAKGGELAGSDGKPVPLVDSTLLVDRFILVGQELKRNMEVRFQRSRSRSRPQSRKDSLGAKDMDGNPFYEPTQELRFIGSLTGGRFAALVLPTQVAEVRRWQIFAQNARSGLIDSFNIEMASDGLFNTRGSQIFTCVDHPAVFDNRAGTCMEPDLLNPAVTCDKPLVPRLVTSGFAETALKLSEVGDFVQIETGEWVGPCFTLEAWAYPERSSSLEPLALLVCNGGDGELSGPILALERQTRLRLSFMHNEKLLSYTTKSLVTPDQWNHLAVSFNGEVVRFYINGKLCEKTRKFEKKPPAPARVKSFGAAADGFLGILDDVRIWNRARTGREIQDDLHRRLTGLEPGLAGYWRFDEANGTRVYDATGNGGNGSLQGGAQMTLSDAPLGESQGINRNSFGFEGRQVISGPAALLYYQQTEATSGYSGEKKRLKQNGRVMLAVATQAAQDEADDKPYIAVLDFAVSCSGQLSQVPDQVHLPEVRPDSINKGSLNDLLDQYAGWQVQYRLLGEEISRLEIVLTIINRSINDPGQDVPGISDPAYKKLNTLLARFTGTWKDYQGCKMRTEYAQNNWSVRNQKLYRYQSELKNARVIGYQEENFCGNPLLSFPVGANNLSEKKELVKQISSIQIKGPVQFLFNVRTDKGSNPSELFKTSLPSLRINLPNQDFTVADLLMKATEINVISTPEYDQSLKEAHTLLEEAEKDLNDRKLAETKAYETHQVASNKLVQARDELQNEVKIKSQHRAEVKAQLDQLQSFMNKGVSTTMPQVFIDPSGLSVSGGLLSFAWTEAAPLLFDSANGNVALYFQGSDDQFFVTYYDTLTERARYELQTNRGDTGVVCVSRSSDLESDQLQIEVSADPDDPVLCRVKIAGSGIEETWRKVSRLPEELARILNGEYANREFFGNGTLELQGGQIVALNLPEGSRRGTNVGKTLVAGNIRLSVQADVPAGSQRIPVQGDRLNAPTEFLPVYYLEYDYAVYAQTTYLPADLYNGSLLVRAVALTPVVTTLSPVPLLGGVGGGLSPASGQTSGPQISDQKVTSGATLTCKWTAAAPGCTLAFDGTCTLAVTKSNDTSRFAAPEDLTLEAWIRPARVNGQARLIQQRSDGSAYTLGLKEQTLNSALALDGKQSVELSGGPVLSVPFTQEAWIYPTPGEDDGYHGFLGDHPDGEDATQRPPSIWSYQKTKLHAGFGNGQQWLSFVTEDVLVLETWNHVAVSFDGETYRVYVNGSLKHVETEIFKGQKPVDRPLKWIGRVDNYFIGQIDEVRVWKRARSENDILADMNRRLSGQETDLIGYWHFDNLQAQDYSRIGCKGELRDNPQQAASPLPAFSLFAGVSDLALQARPVIPAGSWVHLAAAFDQAYGLQFDGQGGYLDCGNDTTLDINTDLTIELGLQAAPGRSMGILSRGRLNDNDNEQDVPYALFLTGDRRVGFAFQDIYHQAYCCVSDTKLQDGYSVITVTRERQQAQTTPKQGETVTGEKVDAWDLISFYINAQPAGTTRYKSEEETNDFTVRQPADVGSSSDPLEVGLGFNGNLRLLGDWQIPSITTSNGKVITPFTGSVVHKGQDTFAGCFSRQGDRTFVDLSENPFQGIISEISLWNKARISGEIQARRPLRGTEKGLVSWWQFQEGRGNQALDSISSNQAKLKGNLAWIKDPNPAGSNLTLYLNGSSQLTDKLETALRPDNNQFCLGGMQVGENLAEAFQGEMEEVRVWHAIRTQEQIQDNLFRRLTGEKEDLIAYYTFDPVLQPVDTSPAAPNILNDYSLRGNYLEVTEPVYILSTAPIGEDFPQVRSALAGVRTPFSGLIGGRPAVQEYADLQMDGHGNLTGVLKRSYSYVTKGQWTLITGFKVGDLTTEWIGQVQFAPQLKGYIEGAPPVPSENLTTRAVAGIGDVDDYNEASSIEVVEAEKTNFTYSASRDSGFDMAVNFKVGPVWGTEVNVGAFGITSKAIDVENSLGLMGQFEHSLGWLESATTGVGSDVTRKTSLEVRGRFAGNNDPLNTKIGRRFIPENTGLALVESETADVFALRLAHNGALIAYQMRPNPDIPKDWNLLHFPINPRYTKQGTLDGKIGLETDPEYPNAKDYSPDISYFKPLEAYALKNRIRREETALQVYFDQYAAGAKGRRQADTHFTEKEFGSGSVLEKLPQLHKRNIINTYVWTADGGLFTETQETMDVRQETIGGSYQFKGLGGFFTDLKKLFGVGLRFELEALFGGHLNLQVQKSQDSSSSFGLNVNLDKVERDLYKRNWEDPDQEIILSGDPCNPVPRKTPGKVDAYRFMTFYLEPKSDYQELFFSRVVDPLWLEQSNDPAAVALREARQEDKKPACWRVMHRVTYVSRILPELEDEPRSSLEKNLRELDIESNYELIQQLDPYVADKLTSFGEFSQAIDQALEAYLPELKPHAEQIKQFMSLYYGLGEDQGGLDEQDSLGEGVRVPNQPPVVNAGQDLILGLDGAQVTADLEGAVIDDRLDRPEQIYVTWEKVAGEGEVTFSDPHAIQTQAVFNRRGRYVLRLTADDGQFIASDELNVVVNERPVVRTGSDLRVDHLQAVLRGEILDDGLGDPRTGYLTATWSRKSRTGRVTFEPPNKPQTQATFSTRGHYLLSLTVDNGSFSASSDLMVAVAARATDGLLVLYTFEEGQGGLIHDVSGSEDSLNLMVCEPGSVRWEEGDLALTAPGLLLSEAPATRIIRAVQKSGEVTVEAWVRPAADDFQGLQRILTISDGSRSRNLVLGQNGQRYHAALRTDMADKNAAGQALSSGDPRPGQLDHLVLARGVDGGARLYLNGELVVERQAAGDLSTWDPTLLLALGNEPESRNPERAWSGAFHLVALYERALTPAEVRLHYEFGADANLPPILSAGPDLVLDWPAEKELPISMALEGRVTHDRPEKTTQVSWTQVAGPESPNGVEFSNPFELRTSASFVRSGKYRLRLTADDGSLMSSAELEVVVNQPPTVQVEYDPVVALTGPVVEVTARAVVMASGLGREEDLPDRFSSISYSWEQIGGPISLKISGSQAAIATLSVFERGVYNLLVTVNNGMLPITCPLALVVHQLPVVTAGAPIALSLPLADQLAGRGVTVQLAGKATDTGLGDPSQPLEYRWAQVEGPRAVFFADEMAPDTEVTFHQNGRYHLALTVTNREARILTGAAACDVVVNQPPQVDAGPDQIVNLPSVVELDGTASDDGLPDPPGRVKHRWSKAAGPGVVTFEDSEHDCTTASFNSKGMYTLELATFDGQDTVTDRLKITVNNLPVIRSPSLVKTIPGKRVDLCVEILDDGLGDPALGEITVQWQPGDDRLNITNPVTLQTEATSTERGLYPVNLAISNGFLTNTTVLQVAVFDVPVVNAGQDAIVRDKTAVLLAGKVIDNGLGQAEPGPATICWELENGPAAPKIANPAALDTGVYFPAKGIYLLRLTVDNGFFHSSDTVRYTVNQKPLIKSVLNTEIKWNESLPLKGQVIDDGLGDPALGEVTAHWSVSGQEGARIENPDSLATQAHFAQKGIYNLCLEVNNGFVSSKADSRIVVNQPPLVSAGKDQSVRPGKASLVGQVVDDGLGDPTQSRLAFQWTQVSGPQDVKFSNSAGCETQVTMSRIGVYVFQFEASYGDLYATDQVRVEVRGNTIVGGV